MYVQISLFEFYHKMEESSPCVYIYAHIQGFELKIKQKQPISSLKYEDKHKHKVAILSE